MKTIIVTIIFLLNAILPGVYAADEKLGQTIQIYNDKNGYFTALAPTGWRQKDFPEETVRSKVEFINEQKGNISIRVIAGPVQNPSVQR